MILVDTDVLIWVTRKNPHASEFLDTFDDFEAVDGLQLHKYTPQPKTT